MFGFIITLAVVIGVIYGARTSFDLTDEGETVRMARFGGLLRGGLIGWIVFLVGMALWGAGSLWWSMFLA